MSSRRAAPSLFCVLKIHMHWCFAYMKVLGTLKLELLGVEPGSSRRAVCALNYGAISQVPTVPSLNCQDISLALNQLFLRKVNFGNKINNFDKKKKVSLIKRERLFKKPNQRKISN